MLSVRIPRPGEVPLRQATVGSKIALFRLAGNDLDRTSPTDALLGLRIRVPDVADRLLTTQPLLDSLLRPAVPARGLDSTSANGGWSGTTTVSLTMTPFDS